MGKLDQFGKKKVFFFTQWGLWRFLFSTLPESPKPSVTNLDGILNIKTESPNINVNSYYVVQCLFCFTNKIRLYYWVPQHTSPDAPNYLFLIDNICN